MQLKVQQLAFCVFYLFNPINVQAHPAGVPVDYGSAFDQMSALGEKLSRAKEECPPNDPNCAKNMEKLEQLQKDGAQAAREAAKQNEGTKQKINTDPNTAEGNPSATQNNAPTNGASAEPSQPSSPGSQAQPSTGSQTAPPSPEENSELTSLEIPEQMEPNPNGGPREVPGGKAPPVNSPALDQARSDLAAAEKDLAHVRSQSDNPLKDFALELAASNTEAGRLYNQAVREMENSYTPSEVRQATEMLDGAGRAGEKARAQAAEILADGALSGAQAPSLKGLSKLEKGDAMLRYGADLLNSASEAGNKALASARSPLEQAALKEAMANFTKRPDFGESAGAFANNQLEASNVSDAHIAQIQAAQRVNALENPWRNAPEGQGQVAVVPMKTEQRVLADGRIQTFMTEPPVTGTYDGTVTQNKFAGVSTWTVPDGKGGVSYFQQDGFGGYVQVVPQAAPSTQPSLLVNTSSHPVSTRGLMNIRRMR